MSEEVDTQEGEEQPKPKVRLLHHPVGCPSCGQPFNLTRDTVRLLQRPQPCTECKGKGVKRRHRSGHTQDGDKCSACDGTGESRLVARCPHRRPVGRGRVGFSGHCQNRRSIPESLVEKLPFLGKEDPRTSASLRDRGLDTSNIEFGGQDEAEQKIRAHQRVTRHNRRRGR